MDNEQIIEKTALVVHDSRMATPDIIKQAEVLAEKTWRFMGITQDTAVSTYITGWELGFKMTVAPQFVQVIQGKPTLTPKGHLALLHNSGLFRGKGLFETEDMRDDKGHPWACRVKMRRNDSNVEYETLWTMEDAQRAGIIKKDSGWEKYPGNMLRWRAIGFCADVVASDIGGGMKRSDELGADITPDGDVIQGSWSVVKLTLAELSKRYNVDTIVAANGGKVPATDQEVEQVAKVLAEQEVIETS